MTQEFKDYIAALGLKCRENTFHGEYRIHYSWIDTPKNTDNEHKKTFADIRIDTTYLWAKVQIYPAFFEQYQAGKFEECGLDLLHEFCHLFMEPVWDLFSWDIRASQKSDYTDVLERQTQRICNVIHDHLPKDWYTPESLGIKPKVEVTTA